jgi:hypothetical protein
VWQYDGADVGEALVAVVLLELVVSEQRMRQAVDRALTGGAGKLDGLTTA